MRSIARSTRAATVSRHSALAIALASALVAALAPPARAGELVDPLYADGFECGQVFYLERFAVDAASWPPPWGGAGNVANADVVGAMARLIPQPTGYSLARMKALLPTHDVDATFAFRMEDQATQGVGFYVRQDGGYLQQTTPHGQGYAVFLAGSWFGGNAGIGVWREIDGVEQLLAAAPQSAIASNTLYRARLQVFQSSATTTTLRARYWPDGANEPAAWQVQFNDSTPALQNVTGGIAIDSWSNLQSPTPIVAHTFVDDVALTVLCPAF